MPKSKTDVHTNVRIPEKVYNDIKDEAKEDMRSINAEIVILIMGGIARRKRRCKELEE